MLRVKAEGGQIEVTLLRLRIMAVVTMLLQKRRRRRSEERGGKKAGEEVAKHETDRSLHYGETGHNSTMTVRFDKRMGTEE
jgi:hypothetical protein